MCDDGSVKVLILSLDEARKRWPTPQRPPKPYDRRKRYDRPYHTYEVRRYVQSLALGNTDQPMPNAWPALADGYPKIPVPYIE
jgi:hypothetical protein